MALWDQVKLRYNTLELKALTNVNTPGATTINDTVGTQVASDAAEWFKREVQATFDLTNTAHVPVAVRATVVLLKEYSGKFAEVIRAEKESVEASMAALRKQGAGKRITPATSSELEPSTEVPAGTTVRPNFDTERFGQVTPTQPPAP
jgi:hypothetical protein